MTQHEQEQSKQGRGAEGTIDRNATRRQGSLPSGAAFLVGLQRSAGNRAVAKMMPPHVAVQRDPMSPEEKEQLIKEIVDKLKSAKDNASSSDDSQKAKTPAATTASTPTAPEMNSVDDLKTQLTKSSLGGDLTKAENAYIAQYLDKKDELPGALEAVYKGRMAKKQSGDKDVKAKRDQQYFSYEESQMAKGQKKSYEYLVDKGLSNEDALQLSQDLAKRDEHENAYFRRMMDENVSKDDALKALNAYDKLDAKKKEDVEKMMTGDGDKPGALLKTVIDDLQSTEKDANKSKEADALALAKLAKWPEDRKEKVMNMIASGTSPADAFKAWDDYYKKSVFGKDNQSGQQYGAQYSNMMSKW